jgi:DNA polymerase I-like protein with 3'-5' exonuclease and polymerase domains|tara:strand:+ start:13221 stop:14546 length:1326 start_codon:yes stop_codon:yes gene_type:complete
MFYIVEEEKKLNSLENLVKLGCYVEVITSNDFYHPKLTTTVAVYIRMVNSKHGFIIPIDHDEGLNVDKDRVYEILSKANKLYTINKKKLLYHFNLQKAIDLSLLYSMNKFDRLEILTNNSTINFYYSKYDSKSDINKLIPISKLYEKCEETYENIKEVLKFEVPSGFDFYNKIATNVFFLLEQKGVGTIYDSFKKLFKPKNTLYNTVDNIVYTEYNLYNPTSRPTNTFNSVNFAAIPKAEEYRKCFKPQNDFFVEFDFDGYHLRLLAEQLNYPLTEESAHKQLAKHYFGKEEITDEEYAKAKQINFHAIYGKIPEEHKNLKIFKEIQEYIDTMWKSFQEGGYVWNPQSGKHFTQELKDMNPAKLMNYMMQSLETSNNIIILKDILEYLKNKKSFITLYTYDAILFDFNKEDGRETLEDITRIMENQGKYPVKFKYSTNLVL